MEDDRAEMELLSDTEIGTQPLAEGEELLSFFTVAGYSKALSLCRFTADRELQNLIEIFENKDLDPTVRMGACEMIRKHMREALLSSGLMGRLTATQTRHLPDGTSQVAQLEQLRLQPMLSQTHRMLEEAKRLEHVLDVGSQEVGHEQVNDVAGEADGDTTTERRDLGGGGVCPSAQRAAKAARARAAALVEGRAAGDGLGPEGRNGIDPGPAPRSDFGDGGPDDESGVRGAAIAGLPANSGLDGDDTAE